MRVLGQGRHVGGELLQIGTPVAHVAIPAGVDAHHFHPQPGRHVDHAADERFVDRHPITPTVVHQQREIGRRRGAKMPLDPAAKAVGPVIHTAVVAAQKRCRCLEAAPGASRVR